MDLTQPARLRELTERLVAIRSVSPDPWGEGACAEAIRDALPTGLERGEWRLPDGRPVLWARLRGTSPREILFLTHYDTVGAAEFAALDSASEDLAFRPGRLRERLLALDPAALPESARADLEEERRRPGTWLFGRGALDMKSGIAAGLGALARLAAERDRLPGSVLFLACPDEEHQSSGMLHAVTELAALSRAELIGALNLDYVEKPGGYEGLAGKLLLGCWVLGLPGHVGDPFQGADAAQIAAALVHRLTTSAALTERGPGARGVPPVALRLRDLKSAYDAQTALEAELELNLLACERPLERTLELLRTEMTAALDQLEASMAGLAGRPRAARPGEPPGAPRVLTYPELLGLAGRPAADDPLARAAANTAGEPRAATLQRVRRLAREAKLLGPRVVMTLLPPYYPPAVPRRGGFADRLRPLLADRGVALEPFYPFISDACYLSWRDSGEVVAAHLPAMGREYRPPIEACRALDLEVVTLGPWGRDAHGLFERVHASYAFGALPELLADVTRAALAPAGAESTRRESPK